jgi:hypothetical protein
MESETVPSRFLGPIFGVKVWKYYNQSNCITKIQKLLSSSWGAVEKRINKVHHMFETVELMKKENTVFQSLLEELLSKEQPSVLLVEGK